MYPLYAGKFPGDMDGTLDQYRDKKCLRVFAQEPGIEDGASLSPFSDIWCGRIQYCRHIIQVINSALYV